MKFFICTLILVSSMTPQVIFDFNKNSNIHNWIIVDDEVMGGESSSTFELNADGYGVFKGDISIENNGGFSSVRYRFKKMLIKDYTKIMVKLKGDGKMYQFIIKSNSGENYSFVTPFSTSGEWQDIEIPLKDMYPSFRGIRLNQPNFADEYIHIFMQRKKTGNSH